MMEEDEDGDNSLTNEVTVRASVFEAYSRDKSIEAKAQRLARVSAPPPPSSPACEETAINSVPGKRPAQGATIGTSAVVAAASLPIPPPAAKKNYKEKFGLKLKKYFASKLSETTTGQGFIQSYISERGQRVVKALCSSILKFSGRDIARVMRRYIYKLATKFGILYAEREIDIEMLNRAREPALILAFHMLNLLNSDADQRRDVCRVQGLKTLIAEAYEALLPLCHDVTRQTNTERLRVVFEYFTYGEFLNFFLASDETEFEREVLCENINAEMSAVDGESTNKFFRVRLQRRRMALSSLLGAPSLHNYLRNVESNKLVTRWMIAQGGQDIATRLTFAAAVDEYSKLPSRSLLALGGQKIFHRFLTEPLVEALPIPQVLIDEIASKVHADAFPLNLYWDAYSAVLQSMEGMFMEFLGSEEFKILQLELHKVEKQLQVLVDLTGISDESFLVLMAKGRGGIQPRKQPIHEDLKYVVADVVSAGANGVVDPPYETITGSLGPSVSSESEEQEEQKQREGEVLLTSGSEGEDGD